jgi:hypothetical protein
VAEGLPLLRCAGMGAEGGTVTAEQYRELIFQFITSLTLCDHMGDAADTVDAVLRRLGINESWATWADLPDVLRRNGTVPTTLHGDVLEEW